MRLGSLTLRLRKGPARIFFLSGLCCFVSCYESPVSVDPDTPKPESGNTETPGGAEGGTDTPDTTDFPSFAFTRMPQVGESYGGFCVMACSDPQAATCQLLVMTACEWPSREAGHCDSILSAYTVSGIDSWRLPTKAEANAVKENCLTYGLLTFNNALIEVGGQALSMADYYYCIDDEGAYKRFKFSSGSVLPVSAGKCYHLRGFADIYVRVTPDGVDWDGTTLPTDSIAQPGEPDEPVEPPHWSDTDSLPQMGAIYDGQLVMHVYAASDTAITYLGVSLHEWQDVPAADVAAQCALYREQDAHDWHVPTKAEAQIVKSNVVDYGLSNFNAVLHRVGAPLLDKTAYYYCIDDKAVYKRFGFNTGSVLSLSAGGCYALRFFNVQTARPRP